MNVKTLINEPLANYSAFGVGGPAKKLIILNTSSELINLRDQFSQPIWVLGYITNCLISDKGLDETVFMLRTGPKPVLADNNTLIIDAATNWDEAVNFACQNDLWGIELMSGIPGNVGAALSGNIAAYGQAIADTFSWAEVLDPASGKIKRLNRKDIKFSYRRTSLQNKQADLIILKLALALSKQPSTELAYGSAVKAATDLNITPTTLANRRKIILTARERAGSIYHPDASGQEKTAGSFFKNPLVDEGTARYIARYDESDKTIDQLLDQNRVHGGDSFRVSAAHVLLAAGFSRGQAWGEVRLHPKHVLKIENTGNATAQQIYDVSKQITKTVDDKLGISLEAEVKFLGEFN